VRWWTPADGSAKFPGTENRWRAAEALANPGMGYASQRDLVVGVVLPFYHKLQN
jgi:hypothetical protein